MLPRRGVIALVTTALGLVLLLSFKTSPATPLARIGTGAVVVAPSPSAQDGSSGTGVDGGQAAAVTPGPSSQEVGSAASPTPPAAGGRGTGTLTGQTVDTPYGPVQVQVTVSGGRIMDVQAVQLPTDRRRSAEISQAVAPMLRSEVLTAQSARIDLVSGATYTSEGYAESLQSALDQAHG